VSPTLSPHSPRCQHGQMTFRTRPCPPDAPKKGQYQTEPQPKKSAATLKHVNISGKHAIKAQKNTRAQQRINTHLELAPPLKAHILLLCPVRSQISRYNWITAKNILFNLKEDRTISYRKFIQFSKRQDNDEIHKLYPLNTKAPNHSLRFGASFAPVNLF